MFEYAKKKQKNNEIINSATQLQKKTKRPNMTGIPDITKEQFENLSGFSFDDVRVHYNSDKPAQLQALAYTQGNQVYVASGQEKHLGHELGHVVQQKEGRVNPEKSVGNIKINNEAVLENEATRMSNACVQRKIDLSIVQRMPEEDEETILNDEALDSFKSLVFFIEELTSEIMKYPELTSEQSNTIVQRFKFKFLLGDGSRNFFDVMHIANVASNIKKICSGESISTAIVSLGASSIVLIASAAQRIINACTERDDSRIVDCIEVLFSGVDAVLGGVLPETIIEEQTIIKEGVSEIVKVEKQVPKDWLDIGFKSFAALISLKRAYTLCRTRIPNTIETETQTEEVP